MSDFTPPLQPTDKLLDELSRRVFYAAMTRLEGALKNEAYDNERLTALADVAAAASAQIMVVDPSDRDSEETY